MFNDFRHLNLSFVVIDFSSFSNCLLIKFFMAQEHSVVEDDEKSMLFRFFPPVVLFFLFLFFFYWNMCLPRDHYFVFAKKKKKNGNKKCFKIVDGAASIFIAQENITWYDIFPIVNSCFVLFVLLFCQLANICHVFFSFILYYNRIVAFMF